MASFVHRIEVHYTRDPRLKTRTDRIRTLGIPVDELHLTDVYTIATSARDFTRDELVQVAQQLINPVVQEFTVDEATLPLFDHAIEVGFLPGVTDNVGTTARQTVEDFLSMEFAEGEAVYSSQLYFVRGRLAPEALRQLAGMLANPLVNRVRMKTREEYGKTGMDRVVPHVELHELPTAGPVDLDLDDAHLAKLGKEGIVDPLTGERRGPLALDLAQLHAIRDYFRHARAEADRRGARVARPDLERALQAHDLRLRDGRRRAEGALQDVHPGGDKRDPRGGGG